jgi:hypothetical protein
VFGWGTPYYERANVSRTRPPREQLDAGTVERIRALNALDLELAEHARRRFERDVQGHGASADLDVAAFRRANARRQQGRPPVALVPRNGEDDASLVELLAEARATALLGDEALASAKEELKQLRAEVIRLRRVLDPEAAPPPPVDKEPDLERPSTDVQLARTEASLDKAHQRLADVRARIVRLEETGPASGGGVLPRLQRLREREAVVARRVASLEQRCAELRAAG